MARTKFTVKRRVWVGMLAGVAGVAAWGWWVRARKPVLVPVARPAAPFVQLAGSSTMAGSKILQERAELMDPTPLFFPTEWNYGQRPLNVGLRQSGQIFGSYEAKLTVNEQSLAPFGAEVVQVPDRPTDLLRQGNEAPFAGLGQMNYPKPTLPVRASYLQVRKLGELENYLEQPLEGIQLPRLDFAPVEFLVLVGSAGLIGEPVLISGSGWDEVDNLLRSYLATSYHLGERLSPGRYRVLVGT